MTTPHVSPIHYTDGGQPIDIAQHLSFNLGNVIKYAARAGRKGDAIEDLRKARRYLDAEITRLAEQHDSGATHNTPETFGRIKKTRNLYRATFTHNGRTYISPWRSTREDLQSWLDHEQHLIETNDWTPALYRPPANKNPWGDPSLHTIHWHV